MACEDTFIWTIIVINIIAKNKGSKHTSFSCKTTTVKYVNSLGIYVIYLNRYEFT
jgi:hypothetical protein